MIIGYTRIRNESEIIIDTLNHLATFCSSVVVYDDASTDNTVELCKLHPIVAHVIEGKEWDSDRMRSEWQTRDIALKKAQEIARKDDWLVYIDADERIEFDWTTLYNTTADAIKMKLFDFYITHDDLHLNYSDRKWIGPEYREILIAFKNHPELKYHKPDQREVTLPNNYKVLFDGYVKHYGKSISIDQWEDTCNYYSNTFPRYASKWNLRKGRAIHTKSDFGNELIQWEDKDIKGELLTANHHNSEKPLNILVTNIHMMKVGGSETFTSTFVKELISRGHNVDLWTKYPGEISNRLTSDTGCKVNQLKKEYDVIFINHYTMAKRVLELDIKGIKIQTCHGIVPDEEQPHTGMDFYISITEEVKQHLKDKGFESTIIFNGIDCNEFKPINPINYPIKKLYSLSHNIELNKKLESVCKLLKIEFDYNDKYTNPVFNIYEKINESDVVAGIGRGCYESMACGRPVIMIDHRKYSECYSDGLLTKDNLHEVIKYNCSGRRYKLTPNINDIKKMIESITPELSKDMRETALEYIDMKNQATKYIQIFNKLSTKK